MTTIELRNLLIHRISEISDKKANEQTYFKEHSAHLKSLRDAGKIKFGARYSANGMLVITAPSFQAAKEMINSDPSMINKLFKNDIQKLFVFYEGCVSKIN